MEAAVESARPAPAPSRYEAARFYDDPMVCAWLDTWPPPCRFLAGGEWQALGGTGTVTADGC